MGLKNSAWWNCQNILTWFLADLLPYKSGSEALKAQRFDADFIFQNWNNAYCEYVMRKGWWDKKLMQL